MPHNKERRSLSREAHRMNPRTYDSYVKEILKQGNLTRAAAEIGISQPALSAGLMNLEAELGFRIFNRKTMPVSLTPEGRLYIEYIERLAVFAEDFEKRLADSRSRADSRAVIGGPEAYINSLVTDTVIRLLRSHPEYRITFRSAPLGELIEMASRGELDCFISTSERLPERFEKRFIKKEKVYLCVPKSDPINEGLADFCTTPGGRGQLIDFCLLNDRPFVCLEEEQPLQRQFRRFAAERGISVDSRIVVDQVYTAVRLAAKGVGACFASEDALAAQDDLSGVCLYALPESVSGRAIYVAYDDALFRSEACGAFIALLETENAE